MRWILLAVLLVILPAQAFANKECYSAAELQAEQLLRLHSQLMVIAYACKLNANGVNLISVYTAFTQNNLTALQDADKTLLNHYKTQYGDDGIAHLDDLHTRLGNEAGQQVADQAVEPFCAKNRDRVVLMFYTDPQKLNSEVQRMMVTENSIGLPCKMAAAAHPAANMDKSPR